MSNVDQRNTISIDDFIHAETAYLPKAGASEQGEQRNPEPRRLVFRANCPARTRRSLPIEEIARWDGRYRSRDLTSAGSTRI
jgi:hypothetical protein